MAIMLWNWIDYWELESLPAVVAHCNIFTERVVLLKTESLKVLSLNLTQTLKPDPHKKQIMTAGRKSASFLLLYSAYCTILYGVKCLKFGMLLKFSSNIILIFKLYIRKTFVLENQISWL